MAKEELIEMQGVVNEILPDSRFRVTLTPLLPEVGDFQPDAVRIGEEARPVVRRVLRMVGGRTGLDAGCAQPLGRRDHVVDRIDAQAEVMQARRVGIVPGLPPRRPQHKAEVAVEVLDVGIAAERKATVAQIALAWLFHQPHVTSVILGARTAEQLAANLAATSVKLTGEDLQKLNPAIRLERVEGPHFLLQTQPKAAAAAIEAFLVAK